MTPNTALLCSSGILSGCGTQCPICLLCLLFGLWRFKPNCNMFQQMPLFHCTLSRLLFTSFFKAVQHNCILILPSFQGSQRLTQLYDRLRWCIFFSFLLSTKRTSVYEYIDFTTK